MEASGDAPFLSMPANQNVKPRLRERFSYLLDILSKKVADGQRRAAFDVEFPVRHNVATQDHRRSLLEPEVC